MNYLELAREFARHVNPEKSNSHDTQIDVIQVVMQLLTFGLILTFCGVGIKKAVEKVKGGGGVSSGGAADNVLTKIKSSVGGIWRLARGKTKTPPEPREQELAVRHPTRMADALPTVVNPMRGEGLPEGWAEAKSEQGDTYYHNTGTGQTSWTRPEKEARLSNL